VNVKNTTCSWDIVYDKYLFADRNKNDEVKERGYILRIHTVSQMKIIYKTNSFFSKNLTQL